MKSRSAGLPDDALYRVLDVARHLSASADLKQILAVIIDAMRDLLDARRATVFEYDAKTHELFTTVAHGLTVGEDSQHEATGELRLPARRRPRRRERPQPGHRQRGRCAQ